MTTPSTVHLPYPRVYLVRHGNTEWSTNGRHTGLTDIPLLPSGIEQAKFLSSRIFENPNQDMVHIDNITLVLVSPLQRAQQTYEQLRNGGIAREQQTQQQNPNSPPRPSCFTQTQARTSGMLVEWDYGDYEGVTTKEILKTRPNWSLFGDNVPNGETVEDVSARADAIIALIHNYQRGIDPNGDSTTALTMPKTRIELERQKSLQNQETVPADSAQEGTILDETNCVQIPTDVGRRDVLVVAHGHFLRVFAARWLKLNGLEGRNFVLDTASVSVLGYEHTLEERVIKVWNSPAHY